MDPKRGLIIKDFEVQNRVLRRDTRVWIHLEETEHVTIEYKNKFYSIPKEIIIHWPVPVPSDDELVRIDSCFLSPISEFVEVYNSDKYFRILKCKKHNNTFLEDYRGGAMMYSRMIYIENPHQDPEEIWTQYHYMSDAWLNYLKIAK